MSVVLAIETSTRLGSISLWRDGQAHHADLPEPRRHRLDLMPAIDALCRAHDVKPTDLEALCISAGPGSFTGLRVAFATARMLAMVTGAAVVATPSVDVLAAGVPAPDAIEHDDASSDHPAIPALLVALGVRHEAAWTRLYHWSDPHQRWVAQALAGLTSLDIWPDGPVLVAGDSTDMLRQAVADAPQARLLDAALTRPHSRHLLALGLASWRAGDVTPLHELVPLYAREPEAVTLWDAREAGQAQPSDQT